MSCMIIIPIFGLRTLPIFVHLGFRSPLKQMPFKLGSLSFQLDILINDGLILLFGS